MSFLATFFLAEPAEIDRVRTGRDPEGRASLDSEGLFSIVSARKKDCIETGGIDSAALARLLTAALGVTRDAAEEQVEGSRIDGEIESLYALPPALTAHLASLDDAAQRALGEKWERATRVEGIAVLVPKLARLAARAGSRAVYLVVGP